MTRYKNPTSATTQTSLPSTAYLICQQLDQIKKNYDTQINILAGLTFRQKDVIKMIEFYSNSKYLNGQKDELGRDKPYFQILNGMCDVENAAKDIDTADISVTSDDSQHYVESHLMSKDIYEWMKATNFAKTLNDMRDTHTRYGSLLVKKCIYEKDGEQQLKIEMPEWKNVITDQIDIQQGAIVEVHYMTPTELLQMKEWKNTKEAIANVKKENVGKRIPVYEVRGDFPRSYFKQIAGQEVTEDDGTDFSYQLYYLAGEYSDINKINSTDALSTGTKLTPLYWEDNTERIYKYLARKPKSGRAFGVGVFEEGEEAQVWTNDVVLKQNRAMAYTTKVVGQTASKKLKGRNILTEVDDGQILEHDDGKPVTALTLLPAGGLNQYQALIDQWFTQLERATSAYSAQRGESPPSRTSYRLQAQVLQQSGSVIEDLQEELGIFITEIFTDWIMPFLASKLNAEHILSHDFTMDELNEIDKNFATNRANEIAKQKILSGQIVTADEYAQFLQQSDQLIKQTRNRRFLEIPKNYYKKLKPKITVNVTGEQKNKAAILESLSNIMMVYARNPNIALDPVLTQLFLKIVELSGAGISPMSLISAFQQQARLAQQQAQNGGSKNKISESINFKDLPPDGQVQMAEQAGIKISPPQPVPVAGQAPLTPTA